ncbi:MAG: ATP-binding protein [Gemmatimonadetes bacterium]|nr:ATP-binding protein [Gemmatimonadota bacterium]
MSAAVSYERVREQFQELKMEAALTALDPVLEEAQKAGKLTVQVLDELLGIELAARFERRVTTNLKLSGLPRPKTLEEFDFDAQPQVPRDVVAELATLRFLHNGENVLLLGPCGVGKTHLATGLALKAIEHGHRVYFLTLHDLVTRSRAHRERNRLDSLLRVLIRPQVLILDEIGYLPLEMADATFLFEVVNKRYQAQKSIILTSNKSFGQWGEIFPDPVLAIALLDRLLHHATTLNIRGESYRLRHRRQAGLVTPPPS